MGCWFDHRWYYAAGKMPGAINGQPRPLCFQRMCVKCGKRQEINYYTDGRLADDGTYFVGKPVWIDKGADHA